MGSGSKKCECGVAHPTRLRYLVPKTPTHRIRASTSTTTSILTLIPTPTTIPTSTQQPARWEGKRVAQVATTLALRMIPIRRERRGAASQSSLECRWLKNRPIRRVKIDEEASQRKAERGRGARGRVKGREVERQLIRQHFPVQRKCLRWLWGSSYKAPRGGLGGGDDDEKAACGTAGVSSSSNSRGCCQTPSAPALAWARSLQTPYLVRAGSQNRKCPKKTCRFRLRRSLRCTLGFLATPACAPQPHSPRALGQNRIGLTAQRTHRSPAAQAAAPWHAPSGSERPPP